VIRRALALTLSAALLAAPGSTAAATPLPLVPPPPDLTSLVPFAEAPVEKPPIAALDLPLPPSPAELPPMPLASIVEREARAPQERPLIAGVFINRLKKHWYLESCATVEYALGAWKPHLTYKDLDVKSPYNTYRHPGLPPGPICNPGAAALEAAAHPAQTDMMFFVSDGQGTHRFSRYYQEHLEVQKKR